MSDRMIAALGGAIGGSLVALVFLHFYMKVPVQGRPNDRGH